MNSDFNSLSPRAQLVRLNQKLDQILKICNEEIIPTVNNHMQRIKACENLIDEMMKK